MSSGQNTCSVLFSPVSDIKKNGFSAVFFKHAPELESFGIQTFAKLFARSADSLGLTAGFLFTVLFMAASQFHFAENAFTLHFLLQNFQRLTDVIADNSNLNHLNHLISTSEYFNLMLK